MERFSSRTVDELGRIVLQSELRRRLELEKGDKVSLTVVDNIVILQRTDTGDCEICELGMITIPADIRQNIVPFFNLLHKKSEHHSDVSLFLFVILTLAQWRRKCIVKLLV